jgi:hypothetical protein
MIQSWNPMYGHSDATSPYCRDGIHAFYTEATYIDAYLERAAFIAKHINKLPNLAAITLINEPPRDPGPDGNTARAQWYRRVAPVVSALFPGIPILTGVADPTVLPDRIPGCSATTVHLYTAELARDAVTGIQDEKRETGPALPCIIAEGGVPDKLFNIAMKGTHDDRLAWQIKQTLYEATDVDLIRKSVTVKYSGFYPWKMGYDYYDTFNYDPVTDIQCNRILSVYAGIVDRLSEQSAVKFSGS